MTRNLLLLSLISLCACAQAVPSRRLNQEPTASDLQEIRALQAEHTTTLESLRTELRELQGRVDELEYRGEGRVKELESTIKRVSSRVPAPAGIPEDILRSDEEQIVKNTGPAAELYQAGLQSIRTGDFQTAIEMFSKFVTENPDTTFSDNALYWKGLCFERVGEYDRAIVALSEVFQKYPAEDRVPHSLLMLGEVFLKMNAKADAELSFKKLIDDHPKSLQAQEAKKRLQTIKKR